MSDEESLSPGWGCALIIASFVIGVPLGALAISLTWNWFVAPFLNAPTMGIATAVGVRMFVYAIWSPVPPTPNPDESASALIVRAASNLVLTPLVTIALAAIWHAVASPG